MNWLTQLFSRRRLYGDLSAEIEEHLSEKIDEWSLRDAQRFLALFLKRLHADLHKGFHLCAVAFAVSTDGLLPHFGEKQRIASRALRAAGARSR